MFSLEGQTQATKVWILIQNFDLLRQGWETAPRSSNEMPDFLLLINSLLYVIPVHDLLKDDKYRLYVRNT